MSIHLLTIAAVCSCSVQSPTSFTFSHPQTMKSQFLVVGKYNTRPTELCVFVCGLTLSGEKRWGEPGNLVHLCIFEWRRSNV